jgi:hypothetical protein
MMPGEHGHYQVPAHLFNFCGSSFAQKWRKIRQKIVKIRKNCPELLSIAHSYVLITHCDNGPNPKRNHFINSEKIKAPK